MALLFHRDDEILKKMEIRRVVDIDNNLHCFILIVLTDRIS